MTLETLVQLLSAVAASCILGHFGLGLTDYRFYERWCGPGYTRLWLISYLALNAVAGAIVCWVAHLNQNSWEPTSFPWLDGLIYGVSGQGILRAQYTGFPVQKVAAPMTLLGAASSRMVKRLESRSNAAINEHLSSLDDADLTQFASDLYYQHVKDDESVPESKQRALLSSLTRNITSLEEGSTAKETLARAAIKKGCLGVMSDYRPTPSAAQLESK